GVCLGGGGRAGTGELIRGCSCAVPADTRESHAEATDPTTETDIMAHTPVNHPLRPLYRALAALAGAYMVVFGIVGLIVTPGNGLFGQPDDRVLGQGASLFWCIVSLILGAVVLVVTVLGRNLDTEVNKYIGWGLLV